MRYDEKVIDEIQAASDIAEIIGQYLPLKRSGRNFKALCPFHQEKTPSFMVHPEKQIFHCFGCGAGGNVFSFLMKMENSSFPEALRQLAERAHIRLPEKTIRKGEGPSETERLYEACRLACEFYHGQFLDSQKGKAAREYFRSRGFSEAAAGEFKIGWAAEAWRGLFEFLSKKGFSESLLLRGGLIHRSPKGNVYDAFRGRLLFPIRNLQGKVVAFGGRLLGDGEGPKYLNSPETPVFQKRRELFGLDLAKKYVDRDHPQLFVVEGYFDFLRLYESGFKAAVATLGTSLTEDHVQLLKRFADEAVVIYDGDKAGEAASLRGLEVFLEAGMNVKIARLPAGFDPDDFIQKKGAAAFLKILEEARDFFEFKLESMLSRHNRSDSLGLVRITNEFLETFVKVKNPILLDRYLKRLAGSLGIEENSLRSELAKLKRKIAERGFRGSAEKIPSRPAFHPIPREEVMLLTLMIDEPDFWEGAASRLHENDFTEGASRQLFQEMAAAYLHDRALSLAQILNRFEDELFKKDLVGISALEGDAEGRRKAFRDCLEKIEKRRRGRKLEVLRRQIARAEQDRDEPALQRSMQEYQTVLRQKG